MLGKRRLDSITAQDVADLVVLLDSEGAKRESIRKVVNAVAMVLDHAGVAPNPARDRVRIRLPYERRPEIAPPAAEHVLAVDATGMRLGELERLAWGDVDEPRERWRVSQAVCKTGRRRWVQVPPAIFEGVLELVPVPREDRTPGRRGFQGFGGDRFRTAMARACMSAGVPAFSPHDLRHWRISLEHLRGVRWARIGELVGQRNLAVTANTYTHVLTDEAELKYGKLLERDRA